MLLSGDVGATKTNLAVYSEDSGPRTPILESSLPSARYASLEELVGEFLSKSSIEIDGASFGVAGPVVGGTAQITNLPWVIEERRLREAIHVDSVKLINDLEAIAYGITLLEEEDLHTLNTGIAAPRGAMAVIAPGTGLGEAFLIWKDGRYRACPSEGGHADFGPNSDIELELFRYLHNKFGHVSFERICSGQGLPNIYEFLKESGYGVEPGWVSEQLRSTDDPTPIIVNAARNSETGCGLCTTAVKLFISTLAAEAGNLALKVMATGGVYLGGGIPSRILPLIQRGAFMDRFTNKGRFSKLVSEIPVQVICNPKAALMGAALHGLEKA